MKKSNVMLLIAFGLMLTFFLALQVAMKKRMDSGDLGEEPITFITHERSISDYASITVSHSIHVSFKQDSVKRISVMAADDLIGSITTEVNNTTLTIQKTDRVTKNDSVVVEIAHPYLDGITADTGASVESIGVISGKNLKLNFQANTIGRLQLSYDDVQCKLSSEADVKITGDSRNINFSN